MIVPPQQEKGKIGPPPPVIAPPKEMKKGKKQPMKSSFAPIRARDNVLYWWDQATGHNVWQQSERFPPEGKGQSKSDHKQPKNLSDRVQTSDSFW